MYDITDDDALKVFTTKQDNRAKVADTFCTHTVKYPIYVERRKGVKEVEIRDYVTIGQWYPKSKMEKAKDVEKRYPGLQKQFMADLKASGKKNYRKDPGNILNATAIDLKT